MEVWATTDPRATGHLAVGVLAAAIQEALAAALAAAAGVAAPGAVVSLAEVGEAVSVAAAEKDSPAVHAAAVLAAEDNKIRLSCWGRRALNIANNAEYGNPNICH